MNKILIGASIVLVVLVLVWVARPKAEIDNLASPAVAGMLNAEVESFDFGVISMAKGAVGHRFSVKNNGSGPVTIEKIYTSCMCTTATLTTALGSFGPYGMPGHGFIPKINAQVAVGEEAIVEVVFDPTAHGPAGVGKIERIVSVENDAGAPLELRFSAVVAP